MPETESEKEKRNKIERIRPECRRLPGRSRRNKDKWCSCSPENAAVVKVEILVRWDDSVEEARSQSQRRNGRQEPRISQFALFHVKPRRSIGDERRSLADILFDAHANRHQPRQLLSLSLCYGNTVRGSCPNLNIMAAIRRGCPHHGPHRSLMAND